MNVQRIIIADNQALTALAVETIIRSLPQYRDLVPEIVYATRSYELGKMLTDKQPTAVILDYTLFNLNSAEQLINLSEGNKHASFLLLSDDLTADFLRNVLFNSQRIGVAYKDASLDILREALCFVIRGERYIDQHATEILFMKAVQEERHKNDLTQTEREVLKSIAQGKTTKEIAAERFSSIHTINSHRKNIFRKLNVNCAHDAMKYAIRAGLVDESEFYI